MLLLDPGCFFVIRTRLDADLTSLRTAHEALASAHAACEATLSTVVPERDSLAATGDKMRAELLEAKAALSASEDSRVAAEGRLPEIEVR